MAELGGRSRMGVGLSGTPYSPGWDAWGMAGLVSYRKWVWLYDVMVGHVMIDT